MEKSAEIITTTLQHIVKEYEAHRFQVVLLIGNAFIQGEQLVPVDVGAENFAFQPLLVVHFKTVGQFVVRPQHRHDVVIIRLELGIVKVPAAQTV